MKKGFCRSLPKRTAAEQEKTLTGYGLTDKDIYVDGRGAESLSACVASFHGRPGELILAADLRVFGESRKAILDVTAMLERLRITVCDIHSNETSLPMMLDEALAALAAYSRWNGSKKTAKATGKRGGAAKGKGQEAKRAERAHPDVVRRIARCPKLTWKEKSELLGGNPFSTATLRRHYGEI